MPVKAVYRIEAAPGGDVNDAPVSMRLPRVLLKKEEAA
jgi:hypothetical protein